MADKSFWDKEEELVTKEKNKSENVTVKHCEKNGKEYYDIRISKADRDGAFHPSGSGVAIPAEIIDTIVDSIKVHRSSKA